MMYTIRDGYFYKDGKLFYPCGFNYMSSEKGFALWKDWDASLVEKDMQEISGHGFNTIRCFLFWPDFEPSPGKYSKETLAHLDEFARIAAKHGVILMPTLFVGWMSGAKLCIPGCEGRDLFRDGEMVRLQAAHAAKVAAVLKPHGNVLAIDLGNEPASLLAGDTDRGSIDYKYIERWAKEIVRAIRKEDPKRLVTVGTDHTSCVRDNGFRYDKLPVDFLCVHGYPLWSPFVIEGVSSFRASYYIPFMANFASAFGPVMLQEFGFFSAMAADEKIAGYFDVVTHSSFLNGSNGWLSWFWRDVKAESAPYSFMPLERSLGIVRSDFSPKPQLHSFRRFTGELEKLSGLKFHPPDTGIYIPDSYYSDEEHMKAWRVTEQAATSFYYSFMLLKSNAVNCEFFKHMGDAATYKAVFLPGAHNLSTSEITAFEKYAHEGGKLYISSGSEFTGYERLCGVKAADIRLFAAGGGMKIFGRKLHLAPVKGFYPSYVRDGAEMMGESGAGSVTCFLNRHGKGRVFLVPAPIERMLDRLEVFPGEWREWAKFYGKVLDELGCVRDIRCDNPMLEVMPATNASGKACVFAVNHSGEKQMALIEFAGAKKEVQVNASCSRTL